MIDSTPELIKYIKDNPEATLKDCAEHLKKPLILGDFLFTKGLIEYSKVSGNSPENLFAWRFSKSSPNNVVNPHTGTTEKPTCGGCGGGRVR